MTRCANCQTTQGPFNRGKVGVPICKKDIEGCKKRRDKLDRENWDIKKNKESDL